MQLIYQVFHYDNIVVSGAQGRNDMMSPHDLNMIKKQLAKWGYPEELVRKMRPIRLLNCYQNEKMYQEYQEVKDKEYYSRKWVTV